MASQKRTNIKVVTNDKDSKHSNLGVSPVSQNRCQEHLFSFLFRVSSTNRPCFDRRHGLSDGRVFLDIDGAVDGLVPHGGLVRAVDHVDLDLDHPRQRALAAVLGYGLELVGLPLQGRGYEDVERGLGLVFSFF